MKSSIIYEYRNPQAKRANGSVFQWAQFNELPAAHAKMILARHGKSLLREGNGNCEVAVVTSSRQHLISLQPLAYLWDQKKYNRALSNCLGAGMKQAWERKLQFEAQRKTRPCVRSRLSYALFGWKRSRAILVGQEITGAHLPNNICTQDQTPWWTAPYAVDELSCYHNGLLPHGIHRTTERQVTWCTMLHFHRTSSIFR